MTIFISARTSTGDLSIPLRYTRDDKKGKGACAPFEMTPYSLVILTEQLVASGEIS